MPNSRRSPSPSHPCRRASKEQIAMNEMENKARGIYVTGLRNAHAM